MRNLPRFLCFLVLIAGLAGCSTNLADTSTTPTTLVVEETTTLPPVSITTVTAESTTSEGISLPDGEREFAYVTDVEVRDDGTVVVTADYAQFLSGQEAIDAADEVGELDDSGTLPNDYYIGQREPTAARADTRSGGANRDQRLPYRWAMPNGRRGLPWAMEGTSRWRGAC